MTTEEHKEKVIQLSKIILDVIIEGGYTPPMVIDSFTSITLGINKQIAKMILQ